jgi:hypothetical protein
MRSVRLLAAAFGALAATAPAFGQDIKALPGAPQNSQKAQTAASPAAPADPFAAIPEAKPSDVASVDAIVTALYDVISGDAGVKRDWNRFRSLFYPGARMIPTGKNAQTGQVSARVASPEAYIKANEAFLEEGFHEREIHRHADAYGNIVQVFSSYEARRKLDDDKPFARGINSIQLFNDGKRWWVVTVAWSPETSDHPLPKGYAGKPAA